MFETAKLDHRMIHPESDIVILTGAGMSAESGVATFCGGDRQWERHRIKEVASPEGLCVILSSCMSFRAGSLLTLRFILFLVVIIVALFLNFFVLAIVGKFTLQILEHAWIR